MSAQNSKLDEDHRLIPAPSEMRFAPGFVELSGAISYRGPEPAMAQRLLAPVLARLGLTFAPGAPPGPAIISASTPQSAAEALPSAQAYSIEIRNESRSPIELRAGGREGLRHALITLAQLIARYGRRLPVVHISDHPAIPIRGVMLDISRDKVPTMAQLRSAIDDFERLKLNHLHLYTEHTFAYTGHEEVWRDSSPMTPGEIRELDAYSRERGIELAANQNCLGHLHRWLKLPRYAPLAEIPPEVKEWTFETDDGRTFTKTGPHSLCPTDPRSIELIRDLLGQLLPCFSSPFVNIGCDEAFDVGQGRSRDAVMQRGRAAVYFDFVRQVADIVRTHGKTPMFWADIALRHPEARGQIPEGAVPLVWGYEGDAPFAAAAETLRDLSPWFCPGTSSWLSITGRTRVRHANLRAAAECAAREGTGFLVCDWGDRGHRQHWPIALHAIAHSAHEAWTGADPQRPFDPRAAGLHLFGDACGDIGAWLEDVGGIDADLSTGLRNTNALFVELHTPLSGGAGFQARPDLADWHAARDRAASLRSRLGSISGNTAIAPLILEELEHTLRIVEHAIDRAILRRACADEPGGVPRAPARIRLAADMGSILEDHRSLWLRRNRPGGLDDSAACYELIIDDYERITSS